MMRQRNNAVSGEQSDKLEELIRMAAWGLYIKNKGATNEYAVLAALVGPALEKVCNFRLEDALSLEEEYRRQQALQQQLQQQENIRRILQAYLDTVKTNSAPVVDQPQILPEPVEPKMVKRSEPGINHKWLDVIRHPAVTVIIGKRGSGKSGLAHWLLELHRYSLNPYVLGASKHMEKLLPDWIGIKEDIEGIESGSMLLVDEAHLMFNARDWHTDANREISRIVNLARHRGLSLIFVTQEAGHIDKNIVSATDTLIFKEMGILQKDFDRPQLRRLAERAKQHLDSVSGNRNRYSYVYSPNADFEGLLENDLPTYWSNKLSKAYAVGIGNAETRNPKKMTKEEKIEQAIQMTQEGKSYSQIARELGVSKGTVFNWVKGYPYNR